MDVKSNNVKSIKMDTRPCSLLYLNLFMYILFALVLLELSIPSSALSTPLYEYTYTGTAFNFVSGTNTPYRAIPDPFPHRVTVDLFSTSLLIPMSYTGTIPFGIYLTMTDGVQYLDSTREPGASFNILSIGPSGVPTGYYIKLGDDTVGSITIQREFGGGQGLDVVNLPNGDFAGSIVGDGDWTLSVYNIAPVPEPSTLYLLGSGLVVMFGVGMLSKNGFWIYPVLKDS